MVQISEHINDGLGDFIMEIMQSVLRGGWI